MATDEASYGRNHLNVARDLNNLAQLLKNTNRLAEAELLMRHAEASAVEWRISTAVEVRYGEHRERRLANAARSPHTPTS